MKRVLYTQRVMEKKEYRERWDCTDRRVPEFLLACGYCPVPVPNTPALAEAILGEVEPCGILLTGGNSLVRYGGDAPERDETERFLVDACLAMGIPIFAICRGMQFLLDYFRVPLEPVEGHIAIRHEIHGKWGRCTVNSYHSLGAREVRMPLEASMHAADGTVEAVEAEGHRVAAVMWHPEREDPFCENDIARVKGLFG